MKRNLPLSAALALTLSACPLFAQDNQPNPPDRPPQPPRGEGGPRREGPQPGGNQRHEGPQAGGGQRPVAGLFGALDANHDGAIDAEELSHAADVLRKLDKNGDGRITPDEMRPAGGGERPQGGNENRGPQARDGERRGPREPGAQANGPREQGPRGEARGAGPRPEGDRGPRPEGDVKRDGDHQRGPAQDGPRAEGPRDGQRGPGGPREPQRGGELRREGPQGPAPADAAQAQQRGHRRGPWMRDGQNRFAQGPRPDFGPRGQRAPWESGAPRSEGSAQGPMAMGPRIEAHQELGRLLASQGIDPREFRAFLESHRQLNTRGPQGGPGQVHPPGPGAERQGPGPTQRPSFDGPRGSQQQRGPGDMHRPEGRGERGPQGPRDERDGRPQGPRPPDVQ